MDGPTPEAKTLTEVTIELFAVNGRLIRVGDRLVSSGGLTTARWQVLGLLQYSPSTVAQLARERGLKRQAVQQTVNRLHADDMVETGPNPQDRRAPLVRLTERGRAALDAVYPIELSWIEGMAAAIPMADLEATVQVLRTLHGILDEQLLASGPRDRAASSNNSRWSAHRLDRSWIDPPQSGLPQVRGGVKIH